MFITDEDLNRKMGKSLKNILKKRKYHLNFFKEIITLILIYLGRNLYIKSLKGCDGNEFSCLHNIKFIYEGMDYCIKSSILCLLILFLIQLRISKFYNLFILILLFIEFILKDRGSTFFKHGMLNLIGFFSLLILGEILILIILINITIIKKKFKRLKFFIIQIIIILSILINFKNKYYCKNWDRGLNNTFIDNNNSIYPCKIIIPKYNCLIDILGPFLDISRFINCNKRSNKEKHLLYDISNLRKTNKSKIKRIGYPITLNKNNESPSSNYEASLLYYMKNNLIDMDNYESLNNSFNKENPEIILDYSNNSFGELKIRINYNEELSKKRKLKEKNKEANNIIFLFFDNLSRVQFYRQYKKTSYFLKQFFKYEGYTTNQKQYKYHGFEFLKYHKLDKYTLYNAIPMFSGVNFSFNSSYKMISLLKNYKENGFITCNIQDVCHKELMQIGPLKNYLYIEFDHEYAAPSCDPNIYEIGYSFLYSTNGIIKKCLYGKENFEHILDYALQFWNVYKNNKRFLRIVNSYAHEYTGEKSKYTDDSLYNFLKELYRNEQMENTTLYIAADHGYVGLFGIYEILKSNDWETEYALPILIIIETDKKNIPYEKQFNNIQKNQQNLVTPFDIYYTLMQNLYGINYRNYLLYKNLRNGESLFNYINPKDRTCDKYKIPDIHCKCKKQKI